MEGEILELMSQVTDRGEEDSGTVPGYAPGQASPSPPPAANLLRPGNSGSSKTVHERSPGYALETKTPEEVREILSELRSGLREIYGERFRGLYLFGSYARAEARPGSDLDVLVVLEDLHHPAEEIDRTGELTSRVSLAHDVSISRVFVDEELRGRHTPFLQDVRDELIRAPGP